MQDSPRQSRKDTTATSHARPRETIADDVRAWPRCEPALTHFELGASTEYRPTAVMAKRFSPRHGVRKE